MDNQTDMMLSALTWVLDLCEAGNVTQATRHQIASQLEWRLINAISQRRNECMDQAHKLRLQIERLAQPPFLPYQVRRAIAEAKYAMVVKLLNEADRCSSYFEILRKNRDWWLPKSPDPVDMIS